MPVTDRASIAILPIPNIHGVGAAIPTAYD
jgi:hypothetical protein